MAAVTSAAVAVPEPNAIVLVLLALLGASSILLLRRRSLSRPNKLKVLPCQAVDVVRLHSQATPLCEPSLGRLFRQAI